MFGLGAGELLLIGILALILVGPRKLPELAKGLGKGIREFQKAKNDMLNEVQRDETIISDVQTHAPNIEKTPEMVVDSGMTPPLKTNASNNSEIRV